MENIQYEYQSKLATTSMRTEEPMERRLTNILAADIAGYSRWMAYDEEGVIRRLRWARAMIIYPSLSENGGRIVRIMGDGLLVEFSSPVAALQTAISIQRTLASKDLVNLDEQRLRYRIGINSGEAVVDGDDLLGDCVNVAARLEGIAPVGGICLSSAVYEKVTGRIDIPMTSLGAQCLKNIPEPVEVWRVDLNGVVESAVSDDKIVASLCR